jgi:hypothetical protein
MRNGKDVIADYLNDKLNWQRGSFASNVKSIFKNTFEVDDDFIQEWKVKEECPPGFVSNVRKSLQKIGDGFREIKDDIWINLLFKNKNNNMIISDGRYLNELKKVKELNGINVLVYREGFLNNDTNGSEAQIRKIVSFYLQNNIEGEICKNYENEVYNLVDFFILNNGSLQDLYFKIDQKLIPFIKKYYKL